MRGKVAVFNAHENDEDSIELTDADAARRAEIYRKGAALVRAALGRKS